MRLGDTFLGDFSHRHTLPSGKRKWAHYHIYHRSAESDFEEKEKILIHLFHRGSFGSADVFGFQIQNNQIFWSSSDLGSREIINVFTPSVKKKIERLFRLMVWK